MHTESADEILTNLYEFMQEKGLELYSVKDTGFNYTLKRSVEFKYKVKKLEVKSELFFDIKFKDIDVKVESSAYNKEINKWDTIIINFDYLKSKISLDLYKEWIKDFIK